jgi:hypothetical protein
MIDLPLNTHEYSTITPDQVRHELDDDRKWSIFYFGTRRVMVPRGDLSRVRAARHLAETIAAQAAMWERDLEIIEAELVRAEGIEAQQRAGSDSWFRPADAAGRQALVDAGQLPGTDGAYLSTTQREALAELQRLNAERDARWAAETAALAPVFTEPAVDDASDLGPLEGAFERYESITGAQHEREREAEQA